MSKADPSLNITLPYPNGLTVVRVIVRTREEIEFGSTLVRSGGMELLPDGTYRVARIPVVVSGHDNELFTMRRLSEVIEVFGTGEPRRRALEIRDNLIRPHGTEHWYVVVKKLTIPPCHRIKKSPP